MKILLEQKWSVHLNVAILLVFNVESRGKDSGRKKAKKEKNANANSDVSVCNAENLNYAVSTMLVS